MALREYSTMVQQRVNAFMQQKLQSLDDCALELKEALSYGLLLGGKRSRPLLVYAAGEALGQKIELLDSAAAGIECIHAYSLIHDDMPEMDGDVLRRGRPTVHVKFSPQTALLSGDALQALGFEFLSSNTELAPEVIAKQTLILAREAGYSGMCGGQAMDLKAEHQQIPYETLRVLHSKKTGALIKAAVQLGAVAAGASDEAMQALTLYAEKTGLAFQIWDDVLDVAGDSAVTGKPVGNDEAAGKSTYPALFGLEKAKTLAYEACAAAQEALKAPALKDADITMLTEFASFCVERDH